MHGPTPIYHALGFVFAVRCADDADAPALDTLFHALREPIHPAPDEVAELVFDPPGDLPSDRNASLVGLVTQLNVAAQQSSRGQLLLHGAALASEHGDCLVLAGSSGSGKSTLTASLMRAAGNHGAPGFAYLTDESVSLRTGDLRLTPFPKPLQLKRPSHTLLSHLAPEPGSRLETMMWFQQLVPPNRLGGLAIPSTPLFPRLVVLPRWSDGAPLSVERLSEGEAAAALSENAAFFRDVHGGGLAAATRLARRAPAYRLDFGHGDEATAAVLELWETVA